jgi:hypothetical protein
MTRIKNRENDDNRPMWWYGDATPQTMMILGYLIEASDTRSDRCLVPSLDGASPVTVILPLFNSNLYAI